MLPSSYIKRLKKPIRRLLLGTLQSWGLLDSNIHMSVTTQGTLGVGFCGLGIWLLISPLSSHWLKKSAMICASNTCSAVA